MPGHWATRARKGNGELHPATHHRGSERRAHRSTTAPADRAARREHAILVTTGGRLTSRTPSAQRPLRVSKPAAAHAAEPSDPHQHLRHGDTGANRTRSSSFCRALPFHLATVSELVRAPGLEPGRSRSRIGGPAARARRAWMVPAAGIEPARGPLKRRVLCRIELGRHLLREHDSNAPRLVQSQASCLIEDPELVAPRGFEPPCIAFGRRDASTA